MSLGRSVPWTSWEEWNQVGDWLQSKEALTVQKGLDRVATWRSRGRVPLGVDSTACFVETRLRYSKDLINLFQFHKPHVHLCVSNDLHFR